MSKTAVGKQKAPRKAIGGTDLGFEWGLWNNLLLGLGVITLIVGYMALSRGSNTLAPLLLVAGYCVLIPAALLIRPRNRASGE